MKTHKWTLTTSMAMMTNDLDIQNKTINGKCSHCGECCGKPPMPIARKEEKRIRDYIKTNNIEQEPVRLWVSENGRTNIDLRCCFYNYEQKKCNIYEVRPLVCRNFKCDMTFKDIDKTRIANHQRAYWNNIDKNEKTHNLTNFDYLFYNDIEPMIMWFVANNIKDPMFIQNLLFKNNIKVDVIKIIMDIENKFKE